jgi:hypothetical protein
METFVPSELQIWRETEDDTRPTVSNEAINDKYLSGAERIVVETNREKLPLFVESLKDPNYINLRPFYQRRKRWDTSRQSLLIESFIMNVPVPPIFLYERELNSFEVMDGQQRITAIKEFYNNGFALRDLERWPELNGRNYANLPSKIKAGIDRRSVSSIVLLHESAADEEDAILLRQLVFDRLNTGGVRLERQEIRNAVNAGPFNEMLLSASRLAPFRRAWHLPEYSEEENFLADIRLLRNPFYSKMKDVEVVLRFFALRHANQFRGGMQGFLDLYMVKARRFGEGDIERLFALFEAMITLAEDIYGEYLFRPYEPEEGGFAQRPQVTFADAVMVAVASSLELGTALVARREHVIVETIELFKANGVETFSGRANTRADNVAKIALVTKMLRNVALG